MTYTSALPKRSRRRQRAAETFDRMLDSHRVSGSPQGEPAGIARASVVGVELHIHPDVGVCSIRYDELIAVLVLRQQRGYATQPAPGLWNGRNGAVSGRARRAGAKPAPFRPSRQRRSRRGRWLLRHASDSQMRLQAAPDRAASKHFGDSCSGDKAGLSADPAEDSTAGSPGDARL